MKSSWSSLGDGDDDDFQDPIVFGSISAAKRVGSSRARRGTSRSSLLRPSNGANASNKRAKSYPACAGKENREVPLKIWPHIENAGVEETEVDLVLHLSPDDAGLGPVNRSPEAREADEINVAAPWRSANAGDSISSEIEVAELSQALSTRAGEAERGREVETFTENEKPYCDRLLEPCRGNSDVNREDPTEEFEAGTQLNELMNLCWEGEEEGFPNLRIPFDDAEESRNSVECPICGTDITDLGEESRFEHTNFCLDREEQPKVIDSSDGGTSSDKPPVDVTPVIEWLKTLGLSRYEEIFLKEEIDWDTLQRLTEEDLLNLGINALGPRKKIVHALNDLRAGIGNRASNTNSNDKANSFGGNKLITEFFRVPGIARNRSQTVSKATPNCVTAQFSRKMESAKKATGRKGYKSNSRLQDVPSWCCIQGTPFRVDAFRYPGGDCSHWFLTHFHLDHYQGLTRSFHRGKIYCSLVTARLLNSKIGISWSIIHVLPLNEKITISGVGVTCVDANHCPGAVIILFEPSNGKPVLHTGDFRYCEELGRSPFLRSGSIHTVILDTTYCNPQYDFPRQEAVIQFILEAIQAESFNPKTLFLIGSYTIGKERVFLEIARVLKKKVYVGAAKLRLLECLGLPKEDMVWLTENEMESHVHVAPMWMIASFKRMSHLWKHYSNRFNLMIAFCPTGWSFGKGKKKNRALGRRWQQGTMIRYEVPYSEHSSFTELRDFVRQISPEVIIPSVNNTGPQAAAQMVALLSSDSLNQPITL